MLLLNKVSKLPYLKDISFSVGRGEFVVVYNENRGILQILMKLFNGKEKVDSGIIRLLNNFKPGSEMFNKELGTVYFNNILLNDRTVRENLQFIYRIKGFPESNIKTRVKKSLDLVELEYQADKKPERLLKHQLVKANIAQALLGYPSLLLLDDSLNGMDEVNRRGIYHLLEKINELGTTIVYLSSKKYFFTKNNKIIYLKEGEISNYFIW